MSINSESPRFNWKEPVVKGIVASFLVNAVTHPICTIKNRKMAGLQQSLKGLYNGFFAIFTTESVTFSVNNFVDNQSKEKHTLKSSILAGLVSSPLVAVGEGLMANRQINALSYSKILKKSCRLNGLAMTAFRESPFTTGVFYLAPYLENYLGSFYFAKEHPVITNITSGMITGSVVGLVTTPFDVIKTVVQTSEVPQSIFKTGKVIVLKDGHRGLFRGGMLRFCYSGLSGGGLNYVNRFLPGNLPDSFRS